MAGPFPLDKWCLASKALRASHCGAATPQSQITRLLNSTVNKSQNTLKKYSLFPVYRPIIQQKLSNISKTQMQTVLKLPKKAHKLHLSGLTACPKKGTLDTNGKSHNPFHISSLVASSSLFHSSLLASRTPICWIKLRVPPTNIQESPALRAKKKEKTSGLPSKVKGTLQPLKPSPGAYQLALRVLISLSPGPN